MSRDIKIGKDKFFGSLIITAELYRDRSGSRVVIPPTSDWVRNIDLTSQCNYGRITALLQIISRRGYDDYPGCEIFFLPGDMEGKLRGIPESTEPKRVGDLIDVTKCHSRFKETNFGKGILRGDFGLSIDYKSAKRLYRALGIIIKEMKKKRSAFD